MAENIKITCKVKNESGNQLTVDSFEHSAGKYIYNPSQIDNGKVGSFSASGRKDASYGTVGSVVYMAFDKTTFTINFDISWGKQANSVSNTSSGSNPSLFTFNRTDKTYTQPNTRSNPGSSPVTVYYLIKRRDESARDRETV